MQVPVVTDQGNQVTPRRIVEVPGTFAGSNAVRPHSVKQGFQVQLSQSAIGLDFVRVVRDEQLAVDEMHVVFNAEKKDSPANGTSTTMSTGISGPMGGW